mmetsp:Transcript_106804/g.130253  ORF Transcript_106804/g.130253 Transcript_106804/m.130253 type:complete len:194 (-) Transcript_106804:139-720(-)
MLSRFCCKIRRTYPRFVRTGIVITEISLKNNKTLMEERINVVVNTLCTTSRIHNDKLKQLKFDENNKIGSENTINGTGYEKESLQYGCKLSYVYNNGDTRSIESCVAALELGDECGFGAEYDIWGIIGYGDLQKFGITPDVINHEMIEIKDKNGDNNKGDQFIGDKKLSYVFIRASETHAMKEAAQKFNKKKR